MATELIIERRAYTVLQQAAKAERVIVSRERGVQGPQGPIGDPGATYDGGVAAEALPAGKLCYIQADGSVALSDNSSLTKLPVGFTRAVYAPGDVVTLWLIRGIIDGQTDIVPGARYYLGTSDGDFVSETVALTYNTPGSVLVKIGTGLDDDRLSFYPEAPIIL